MLWIAGEAPAAARRADVALVCRQASRQYGHHRSPDLVLPSSGGARHHGPAIDLGSCPVALKSRRAVMAATAQSAGQTRRGRGVHHGLSVAQQEPVAQSHCAEMGYT
jgi:hypothetical protein